ncbi:unnamed protein product, partial [Hapterophycus canaliculatus]
MEANVTEMWLIVESLQRELTFKLDSMGTDMDTLWLMVGSILVIFMQAGFALLEVSCVGAAHTKNMLVKNLLDLAVAAVMWWSFGWGIAYGGEGGGCALNPFAGHESFFSRGEEFQDEQGGYSTAEGYNWAFFLFQQLSFSGTTVTIVSGAVGARITMTGYVIFSHVMGGFIYPVVVRWGWSALGWASAWSDTRDDLLFGCGVIDFAGSGVIHATGGMAALVMVVLMGPRLGRFTEGGSKKMDEHSVILQTLGAFILWVGWYGFNGCSTGYITGSSHMAAKAMVVTTISAAAAGLGVTSASLVLFQHVGPDEVVNGLLSGLVAITAGCAVVEVEAAFFIGLVAATIYLAASRFLVSVHVDDMVDAAPVHLANGAWGIIAAGLFASKEGYSSSYYSDRELCCGWLYGCGPAQLMANASFLLAILSWASISTFLVVYILKLSGTLRISRASEREGTDSIAHDGLELSKFTKNILSRVAALVSAVG